MSFFWQKVHATLGILVLVLTGCAAQGGDATEDAEDELGVGPGTVGAEPTDPFDPASCAGSPLRVADAARRFPDGGRWVDVGRFALHRRTRTCTALTGCDAWRVEPEVRFGSYGGGSGASLPLGGTLSFEVQGAAIVLQLTSDFQPKGTPGNPFVGQTVHSARGCSAVGEANGRVSCQLHSSMVRTLDPYQYRHVGILPEKPIKSAMQGILTDHCVRLASASRESESVVLGRF